MTNYDNNNFKWQIKKNKKVNNDQMTNDITKIIIFYDNKNKKVN